MMRTQVPPTRRQRTTNYGDAVELAGGQSKPICTYSAEQSGPVSVYVECTELLVPAGLRGTADFRLMVNCDWGAGNASTLSTFDCTYRQRIPVVAGSIELSAWIAAFPYFDATSEPIGSFYAGGLGAAGTGPLAASRLVTAKLRAFIAEGEDATKQLPTFWRTQQNLALGCYVVGQGRLSDFKFWAIDPTGGDAPPISNLYMQLFDKEAVPAAADVPFDSCPVQTGTAPLQQAKRMDQGQTRGFVHGFSWGLSTTPFTFTAVSGSQVAFTTAEFET